MKTKRTVAIALAGLAVLAAMSPGTVLAQTPPPAAAQTAPHKRMKPAAPAPQAYANLAQLMRGIMFLNSNVIFFAQDKNPADMKHSGDASLATDPLAGTFGGWAAVENSSLALTEAANLLTISGRVCSNGLPVPVRNPDWLKFVQGLREAGLASYKAAQSKSNEKMLDAADVVTTACSNCHDRYRRDNAASIADRCK
jgi:hypothetical protein